jgi:hypothetical protein
MCTALRSDRCFFSRTACIVVVFLTGTTAALPAQTLTTLVNFNGTNGDLPGSSLVKTTDWNLYGPIEFGGSVATAPSALGVARPSKSLPGER